MTDYANLPVVMRLAFREIASDAWISSAELLLQRIEEATI